MVFLGIPLVIFTLLTDKFSGNVKFTVAGFITCIILVPLQCCAEEYVFRGLVMQAFGSWIKLPVIAIILQALVFAATHPYNIVGVISVALMGTALGVCAYITNGLEASCAAHIVNNMITFLFTGFGFGAVQTDVDVISTVVVICCMCLYIAFLVFAKKKLNWFEKVKKDDAKLVMLFSYIKLGSCRAFALFISLINTKRADSLCVLFSAIPSLLSFRNYCESI